MLSVVVLLSVGRHPVSGRSRRAPMDGRALRLALGLPGSRVVGLHAGDPDEPVLRDYLAQGLERLRVLRVPADHDPVPPLAAELQHLHPSLVLAGMQAEGHEDSGLVPYLLAEAMGCAILPGAVAIELDGSTAVEALPGGRRRVQRARWPLVTTVGMAAPAPGPIAFAKARRGVIEAVAATSGLDAALAQVERRPARRRMAARVDSTGRSALERLRAATETAGGQGRLIVGPTPDEAADAIVDHLVQLGVLDLGVEPTRARGR
jgi:electron transfer flavoprotein beta subunit